MILESKTKKQLKEMLQHTESLLKAQGINKTMKARLSSERQEILNEMAKRKD